MLNQFVLVGTIASMPQLDTNQTSMKVKVDRNFANYNGIYESDLFECIVWKILAQQIIEQSYVGEVVGIKGRIQIQEESVVMVAEQITFISGKKS